MPGEDLTQSQSPLLARGPITAPATPASVHPPQGPAPMASSTPVPRARKELLAHKQPEVIVTTETVSQQESGPPVVMVTSPQVVIHYLRIEIKCYRSTDVFLKFTPKFCL